MTAVNTLTHYKVVGQFPFEPLGPAYSDDPPAPIEGAARRPSGPEPIIIRWRGLNAQRGELVDGINGFWRAHSLDQLAMAQNVPAAVDVASISGAWPPEDLDDGFAVAFRQWRDQDAELHR